MKPFVTALALAFVVTACAHRHGMHRDDMATGPTASAALKPTQGNEASGDAKFTQLKHGVRVQAFLKGLTPGMHGIHVHEKGDCSAPDASSAGAHFNPTGRAHGANTGTERHGGDLGNIEITERGSGYFETVVPDITIASGSASIKGSAIVVHADPDDLKSQPAGNSGKRIACGVIS